MNEVYRPGETSPAPDAARRRAPLWHRGVALVLRAVLPLAILAGAGWQAREVYLAAPVPGSFDPERRARAVEVVTAAPATRGPVVEAWGAVEPERRLVLAPETGGRVAWVSPALTPGAFVAEGATLLRFDDRDAAVAVRRAEARLAEIDARMRIERGQQQRARSDLDRAPLPGLSETERALILREPQMQELEARRAAAEADLEAARIERARTRLAAPFDAQVASESVEAGAMLAPGEEAAVLTGTGAYRVVLSIPPGLLDPLEPLPGRRVTLSQPGVWPPGTTREGRVARVKPGLTETGRMAQVIVTVRDPLARAAGAEGAPRLLVGSYLRGEIEGPRIPGAVALDRAHLREDDRVWVMTGEDRLAIRSVGVAWRGAETVLVTEGLAPGERVVTTPLATAAEGMALRLPGPGGA